MDYKLEKYIPKRDKFLISNKYELIYSKNMKDEFHHVIYFLGENKIEIVIRKLNNEFGWNYDLKLKIENTIISIGSSKTNFKIIECYTNFKIKFLENKNLNYIPKIIIQTNDFIVHNLNHYNTVMSILEKNPHYDYIYFNDLDIRNFIVENFKESLTDCKTEGNDMVDILQAYDLLKCGALKADLFRYCYLFLNGGIYIDSKITSLISFDEIIEENDKQVICSDDAPDSFYNGIIITEKNNHNILKILQETIKNIIYGNYLNDIHEPTGNKLYFKHLKNISTKLNKKKNLVFYNKRIAFKCDYHNYYKVNYKNFRINYNNQDYYHYYNFYINDIIVKFSKDVMPNIFMVFHLKENIYGLNNKEKTGWSKPFNIIVYNINNAISKSITVDISNDSEFIFTV